MSPVVSIVGVFSFIVVFVVVVFVVGFVNVVGFVSFQFFISVQTPEIDSLFLTVKSAIVCQRRPEYFTCYFLPFSGAQKHCGNRPLKHLRKVSSVDV